MIFATTDWQPWIALATWFGYALFIFAMLDVVKHFVKARRRKQRMKHLD